MFSVACSFPDTIGLNETIFLCILGRPYRKGQRVFSVFGKRYLNVLLGMLWSFLRRLRDALMHLRAVVVGSKLICSKKSGASWSCLLMLDS